MLIKKFVLRAAGASLAAIVLLTAQPLRAATSSETARLEKLERAVEQLQKQNGELEQRNAELEQKISALQKRTASVPDSAATARKQKIAAEQKSSADTAEADKNVAAALLSPVAKAKELFSISPWVNNLALSFDARLRYDIRQGEDVTGDTSRRNRTRYRLRLGLTGDFSDNWFFGLRLETAAANRSNNVTFGADTTSTTVVESKPGVFTTKKTINGPFAKNDDGIFVGQLYVGYRPTEWLTLIGGRMENPFVRTNMVWDPELSPEGFAEQFKLKEGNVDIFANLGQFVYDDADPDNTFGNAPSHLDAYLFGWQVGARYNFSKTTYIQVAPTLYNYSGGGDDFQGRFSNAVIPNGSINDLLVFDTPVEFGFTKFKLPWRIWGDFAYNLDASDRAHQAQLAGDAPVGNHGFAVQAGIAVGNVKHKGDWEANVYYERTEAYSLDQNLIDDDFFDARVNIQGVRARGTYAFTDAISLTLTYGFATQIDSRIGTGASTVSINTNPLRDFQIWMFDLNYKF